MTAAPTSSTSLDEFDLVPDPRVLPMLGEISLDLWRCIAELTDNSVDGFIHAARAGTPVTLPRIDIALPTSNSPQASVRVIDNGPGMTPETLQTAVRAGWSGNNPTENLGLFGMGFNIATARMGTVTRVWTTRSGDDLWHGLEIDFDQLRSRRSFRTPHLTRPKLDRDQHGTEVEVSKLKPEQRANFLRQHTQIRKMLSQAYSAMLRPNGEPISFQLFLNNRIIQAKSHCVWGEDRTITLPDIGTVSGVISFNRPLGTRVHCSYCMANLAEHTDLACPCPNCSSSGTLSLRRRSIRGWVGLQRYLHKTEFGIDFIRNGRKIEIGNKDVFVWLGDEGEEPEYPIDDPRGRGRIVGEVHIDHCRVDFAKQRFDRNDPAWAEAMRFLRGEGPLRPEKARQLGFAPPDDAPIFKLFKAFRRSSPQSSQAGAYKRLLIVPDNELSLSMARKFEDGDPEFQSDAKWWALVEEADGKLLFGDRKKRPEPSVGPMDGGRQPSPNSLPAGLLDDPVAPPILKTASKNGREPEPPLPPPLRRVVPSLSRRFDHPDTNISWTVETFEVAPRDPELTEGVAWSWITADQATRTFHFLFNPEHEVFQSMTMTPIDALLTEIAHRTVEISRGGRNERPLADVIASLRRAYLTDEKLDARQMSAEAASTLNLLSSLLVENCPEHERPELFADLPVEDQQQVMRSLAARKIRPDTAISDGSFLAFSPPVLLIHLLERYPEKFFDGNIWDMSYNALDYKDESLNSQARLEIRERYRSYIVDAVWLAEADALTLERATRDELIRAAMSLRLLRPDQELQ